MTKSTALRNALKGDVNNYPYKWYSSGMNTLEPSQPLEDAQQEHFCQLMAEGKTSQGQAYLDAGYECSSYLPT